MVQKSNHERSSPYSNAGKRNTRTVSGRPDQCLIYSGKINPSDMFTKEEKSTEHFQETRDSVMITKEQLDIEDDKPLPLHHKQRITKGKSLTTSSLLIASLPII